MKYEYTTRVIRHASMSMLGDYLNRMGDDGWELVAITPEGCIFKRLKQGEAKCGRKCG